MRNDPAHMSDRRSGGKAWLTTRYQGCYQICWRRESVNRKAPQGLKQIQQLGISLSHFYSIATLPPPGTFIDKHIWDHQRNFTLVNSRYGRAFAIRPFGIGVRGMPRTNTEG